MTVEEEEKEEKKMQNSNILSAAVLIDQAAGLLDIVNGMQTTAMRLREQAKHFRENCGV